MIYDKDKKKYEVNAQLQIEGVAYSSTDGKFNSDGIFEFECYEQGSFINVCQIQKDGEEWKLVIVNSDIDTYILPKTIKEKLVTVKKEEYLKYYNLDNEENDSESISISLQNASDETMEDERNQEIDDLIFGKWKIEKLLGFTRIQNEYTVYPSGHDIIGREININRKIFSTENIGIKRYENILKEPQYCINDMPEIDVIEPIENFNKNSTEYNIIHDKNRKMIDINGTPEYGTNFLPSVNISISQKNELILNMDGEFYLLKRK